MPSSSSVTFHILIIERVQAGLAWARAQGKRIGRPMPSPRVEQLIRKLRLLGYGILKIARQLGVGASVVQQVVIQSAA